MWDKLYLYMKFLDRKQHGDSIEMDQDFYDFCREIGFVTEDGKVQFMNKTFLLG